MRSSCPTKIAITIRENHTNTELNSQSHIYRQKISIIFFFTYWRRSIVSPSNAQITNYFWMKIAHKFKFEKKRPHNTNSKIEIHFIKVYEIFETEIWILWLFQSVKIEKKCNTKRILMHKKRWIIRHFTTVLSASTNWYIYFTYIRPSTHTHKSNIDKCQMSNIRPLLTSYAIWSYLSKIKTNAHHLFVTRKKN